MPVPHVRVVWPLPPHRQEGRALAPWLPDTVLPRFTTMDSDLKAAEKPSAKCVEPSLGLTERHVLEEHTGGLQHPLLVINIHS